MDLLAGLGSGPFDSPVTVSIDTVLRDRSKDWLKLSFDPAIEPDGLTVTIVVEGGATLIYEYGSL